VIAPSSRYGPADTKRYVILVSASIAVAELVDVGRGERDTVEKARPFALEEYG
jgi:hypothetical protein